MTNLGCHPTNPFLGLSGRHSRLLASYLLNRERGLVVVRRLIRDDIDRFTELGASYYVSLLIDVLKRFDSAFPRSDGDA